jgi:hypothetical protein
MPRYTTGPASRSADPEQLREQLEAEISAAMAWVSEGHHAGPDLEFKAREAIREVLARHGVHGARIQAKTERGRLVVDLTLPPSPARVTEVRLRIS